MTTTLKRDYLTITQARNALKCGIKVYAILREHSEPKQVSDIRRKYVEVISDKGTIFMVSNVNAWYKEY